MAVAHLVLVRQMRSLVSLFALLAAGCPTAPPVTINGQNNGFIKDNYDRALVLAVDSHRFDQPQMTVTVPAGKHFLLVRAIRMRGVYPRPHEADVPLFATFEPHKVYNIDSLESSDRMGAGLYTDDHLTLVSEVDVPFQSP